jgi:hypothetical protein
MPFMVESAGTGRSIDGTGLKALETKYCGEMLKAMPLEETSGWNRVESALAYAEFYGARDTLQTKPSRASATGSGSANMSSAGGRLYTSRRRDGCMWMRMRRRRAGKQDYNRFLDVLVKLQVSLFLIKLLAKKLGVYFITSLKFTVSARGRLLLCPSRTH